VDENLGFNGGKLDMAKETGEVVTALEMSKP
jgi:hypothetical protein